MGLKMFNKPLGVETHATDKGWVDSKTGELLVAVKDLDKKIPLIQPTKRGRGRPRKDQK